ncbi:TonB-dependent receptor plug domain-containing protein [Shewanella algae]|uniref:TonB-dependent receptor plug domain-containing protein n=1 Tax=Shewanella algae TaxID=38313 RepID=UPI0021195077|nr:TonB-dependent receptor plug domain-containing protein [Shewanella algae]
MTSEQSRRMAPSGKLPLLLCALAPWPLLAATSQPSKSGSSVLGEPKVEAIEIIEVRGQPFRRELTLTRPGEALVTLEDIEEQQAGNFAEVLDTVPGITLDGGPRSGGEKINVWGFGETEDLNVYVDNAPVGFEQYRYGSFFIDPDMVKRIEVIKGAHDPRSGNGGFGGSMYVVTKSADDFLDYGKNLGARVKASYADNNGLETYTGTLYGRLNSGLSALVNYSYKDAGDLELGNGQVFRFSGYRQNNLLAKLDYELGRTSCL